jgi:glucokinase
VTVAGVDLGGSKIAGVLLDGSGEVRAEVWREHRITGPDAAVRLIAEVVSALRADAAATAAADAPAGGPAPAAGPPLTAVGLSVAGWLSRDRLRVLTAANLGITKAPLARLAQARLGCPVVVENDGNAAAFAEYVRGAGRAARVLMLITLGTGVGGGIASAGALAGGSHGLAGELGHVPVDRAGPVCSCGAHGCLEVYASGPAVAAQARAAGPAAAVILALAGGRPEQITARHVVQAARGGDACAVALLAAAGRAVGQAVAAAMPVIDPDLVVLSGSVALSAGDLILDPARQELARRHPLPAVLGPVPIVLGQTGASAAALGAAELARRYDAAAADPSSWPARRPRDTEDP